MNFKKGLKTLGIIAAAATILGGSNATAATYNINIYGASAQYLFWNDTADDFLTNKVGCSNVQQAQHTDPVTGKNKHGITKGTKQNGAVTDTYYIRYTSKASYDGIYSCYGETSVPGGQPSCSSQGPRYREMADENNTNFGTGVVSALACKKVTIGASDVAGETFGQSSSGAKYGPAGGGNVSRTVPKIDTQAKGLTTYYRPVMVPFGFFANKTALPNLDNLTRLQALMVFSGKAFYWSDFGPSYPAKDVIACLRHAGSGTHATLNAAVMRNDENLADTEAAPYIWFNDGSSEEMACVNVNGGESTSTAGAVGYADADQKEKCFDGPLGASAKYANTVSLKYNGAAATRDNIKGAVYSFWSHQWLYECEPAAAEHSLIVDLYNYAKDASHLPASKQAYWSTESEMTLNKGTDYSMPSF